jgi:hypothetical protein
MKKKKQGPAFKPPIEISAGNYLAYDSKHKLVEIKIIQVLDNEYVKYDDGSVSWTDMTKFLATYTPIKKLPAVVSIPQIQELGNFRDKYLTHPEMPKPVPIWYTVPNDAPQLPQIYCITNT